MSKFITIESTNEWLAWHSSGISGTDITRIMTGGIKGWNSLISEKLSIVKSENIQVERFKDIESSVISKIQNGDFAIESNISCTHDNNIWLSQMSGYHLIEDYCVEIKIATADNSKYLKLDIDDEVLYELNWQMLVTGFSRSRLLVVYNNEIVIDTFINANKNIQRELSVTAEKFWSMFLLKKAELTGEVYDFQENEIDKSLRELKLIEESIAALNIQRDNLRAKVFSQLDSSPQPKKKYISLVATVSYKNTKVVDENNLNKEVLAKLGSNFKDKILAVQAKCNIIDEKKFKNLLLEIPEYKTVYNELLTQYSSTEIKPSISFLKN